MPISATSWLGEGWEGGPLEFVFNDLVTAKHGQEKRCENSLLENSHCAAQTPISTRSRSPPQERSGDQMGLSPECCGREGDVVPALCPTPRQEQTTHPSL